MLNERARAEVEARAPSSFSLNLKKWLEVMDKYEAGGFM
jgi:aspartate aminotransferase-like enzyme